MAATAEPPATTVTSPTPEPPATMVASPMPEPPAVVSASPAPGPQAVSPTPAPSATVTALPALGLPATMMTSLWELQQSYLVNCQVGLNNQINLELSTAFVYRSVASYFDGSNVTLSEVTEFFQGQSTQQMWMHNQHEGVTQQPDLNNPVGDNAYSTPMAEPCALCLAMSINQTLLNLQQPATENNDVRLSTVLQEQLTSNQQVGDHPTSLYRQEQPEATGAESLPDKFSQGDKKN